MKVLSEEDGDTIWNDPLEDDAPQDPKSLKANPEMVKMWSERTKCFMCKHRFDKPLLLPVKNPERGKLQPNYNAAYLFHLYDTHGLPDDIVRGWIFGSIYGLELTEMGYRL